ncbi:hypothetical protein PRIPAC_83695 [Pristionchus pacificus]|uniref:Uncharacterized protein n=1 Tax=Pristionchus pacificus TaxID=54126 RepID=A0A2A6BLH9_PRIPA|nr:hypothetical protein PRIPAC_83695 [Pristionchus pacificus]|eukprot:PDM66782.1 hypothetical protein PRIPAC_48199 [Pristionchus pacificus]
MTRNKSIVPSQFTLTTRFIRVVALNKLVCHNSHVLDKHRRCTYRSRTKASSPRATSAMATEKAASSRLNPASESIPGDTNYVEGLKIVFEVRRLQPTGAAARSGMISGTIPFIGWNQDQFKHFLRDTPTSTTFTPLLTKPLINEKMTMRILSSTARNEALTNGNVEGKNH